MSITTNSVMYFLIHHNFYYKINNGSLIHRQSTILMPIDVGINALANSGLPILFFLNMSDHFSFVNAMPAICGRVYSETSMLWPSQNFLLYKRSTLIQKS